MASYFLLQDNSKGNEMAILDSLTQSLYPGQRVIKVDGWQAAEKYPMPRDCEVVMLDKDPNEDHIYMKRTDVNGAPTFERYLIEADPVPRFDPEKYVTVDDFKNFKEEILNGFNSLKQSITGSANSNTKSGGNSK